MANREEKVTITSFTDPVCTWCWGSEPVFRKLETHFPGQVEFNFVTGGLVEDAHTFIDGVNGIGGSDMETYNKQVAAHWKDASGRHGMPVDAVNFALFDDDNPSTFPLNIAYKAAQQVDPDKADLFLYNLRAASAAEARKTNREEVLAEIAKESGIDVDSFLKAMRDGSAEAAFNEDRRFGYQVGAHGFPTFLVKIGDTHYLVNGYNSYDTFSSLIQKASNGEITPVLPEKTPDALLKFMRKHPRMAAEEIRRAFDLNTKEEAKEFIAPLVESGALKIENAGNGWFARLADAA